MRMKGSLFVRPWAFLAAVLAVAPAAAINFPVGTHAFVLTVKDDFGAIATAKDGYFVVITKDGVELARGDVGDFDANGVNCVLGVTMTTEGGGETVRVGDPVEVALYESFGMRKLGTQTLTVGEANGISRYYLQMSEMIDYTEGGLTLSVPKAYVEAWQPYFTEAGKGTYHPLNDPDGDGFSNYDEFAAGTDPLDKDSCLTIVSAVQENGDFLIGFRSVPKQVYTLQCADSLGADANWRDIPFRLMPAGAEAWSFAYPGADTPSDGLTVFRALMSTDKAKFYRIKTK